MLSIYDFSEAKTLRMLGSARFERAPREDCEMMQGGVSGGPGGEWYAAPRRLAAAIAGAAAAPTGRCRQTDIVAEAVLPECRRSSAAAGCFRYSAKEPANSKSDVPHPANQRGQRPS
jgi:hypothetical protein